MNLSFLLTAPSFALSFSNLHTIQAMVQAVVWATKLQKHSQSSPIHSSVVEDSTRITSDIVISALSNPHYGVSTIHRGNRFSFLKQPGFENILKGQWSGTNKQENRQYFLRLLSWNWCIKHCKSIQSSEKKLNRFQMKKGFFGSFSILVHTHSILHQDILQVIFPSV